MDMETCGVVEGVKLGPTHLLSLFVLFETGTHSVALAGLVFTLQVRLTSDLQRPACLCLPSAETKDGCHHTWQKSPLLKIPQRFLLNLQTELCLDTNFAPTVGYTVGRIGEHTEQILRSW